LSSTHQQEYELTYHYQHKKNGPEQASHPVFPSPWKLTKVRGLPDSLNRDTVTLSDIIGDQHVSEIWSFNYLQGVNFLKSNLHDLVKHSAVMHIVYGQWLDLNVKWKRFRV
jgi:hypothetical protein